MGVICLLAVGLLSYVKSASAEPANVCKFGAVADGATDSTEAFQRAIDSLGDRGGRVDIPAGEYVVGELHLRPGVTLQGAAGYSFRRTSAGTTLRLRKDATSRALIDFTGAYGATIRDLALVGDMEFVKDITESDAVKEGRGHIVHGIALLKNNYGMEEDYPLVDHCNIRGFSGDGIHFRKIWCGNVRNALIGANGGDGICIEGWDVFITNNEIFGNAGYGIHGVPPNNAGTITANRVEWNRKGGLFLEEGSHYCINANYFDRSGTAGVIFDGARFVTFTGNQIYRSGKPEWTRADGPYSAHAVLRNCKGLTFTSNSLVLGRDDDGKGIWSPKIGLVLEKLVSCAVVGNTGHASVTEKFIEDRGGHENSVIKDNVGSVMKDLSQVAIPLPDHE